MTTATTTPKNDTLITYVTDMHALATHGLQAIRRQVENLKNSPHHEALNVVQEFTRVLETHVTALDERATALGGSTTKPVKDAVSAVTGFAAGLINAIRPEEAAKSIRDDYTFLSMMNISYLMLHTTSAGLGDPQTAALAEKGYGDTARMVMQIDRLLPALVIQELRQDGLSITDVSDQCRSLIRKAWNREAKTTGFAS